MSLESRKRPRQSHILLVSWMIQQGCFFDASALQVKISTNAAEEKQEDWRKKMDYEAELSSRGGWAWRKKESEDFADVLAARKGRPMVMEICHSRMVENNGKPQVTQRRWGRVLLPGLVAEGEVKNGTTLSFR